MPPRCIFCTSLLEPDTELQICDDCRSGISFTEETMIRTGTAEPGTACDGAICVCRYTGIVKESLIRFKFYSKPGYYRTFSKLLSDRIRRLADITKYDMIISVPLHKQKLNSRGYNQAFLIARALSKDLMLPERSYLLKRIRNTDAQSRLLDRSERRHNVKDAFEVTEPGQVVGKSILLVDDILTTGFTIDECAKALKRAGASAVTGAVVATGRIL